MVKQETFSGLESPTDSGTISSSSGVKIEEIHDPGSGDRASTSPSDINAHSSQLMELIPQTFGDQVSTGSSSLDPSNLPPLSQPALQSSLLNPHNGAIIKRGSPIPKRLTAHTKHKRNATTSPKSRPAFVLKLWNMVNDTENAEHIRWMPDGQSFQVMNREAFERSVLPKYFKHSNFSSFVRQLNMYGWHKVQDVTAGAMHGNDETWQFKSPYFIQGKEELLDQIVRNKGAKGSDDEEDPDLQRILDELQVIKANQVSIGEDMRRIRKDNEMLWRENYQSRERYQTHSETLDRILRFLASLYSGQGKILGDIVTPGKTQKLLLPNLEDKHISDLESNGYSQLSAIQDLISNATSATSSPTNIESPSVTSPSSSVKSNNTNYNTSNYNNSNYTNTSAPRISSVNSDELATAPINNIPNIPLTSSNVSNIPVAPYSMKPPSQTVFHDPFATDVNQSNISNDDIGDIQTPNSLFPELSVDANGNAYYAGNLDQNIPDTSSAVQVVDPMTNKLHNSNKLLEDLDKKIETSLQQPLDHVSDWIQQKYGTNFQKDSLDSNDPGFDLDDYLVSPGNYEDDGGYEDPNANAKKRKVNN